MRAHSDAQGRLAIVKVIIADDHPVVRQGLRQMLAVEQDLQVVGEAKNGQEVVDLSVSDEAIELTVDDNGVGIPSSDLHGRKSLGLLGMQERALLFGGTVTVSGVPGQGTRVSVRIPFQQNAQKAGTPS